MKPAVCLRRRSYAHHTLSIWWRLLLRRKKPTSADTVHDRIPQPQHCVQTPALLVTVPSFLKLFHLQQTKEGVSQRCRSVSHIPATSRCAWHQNVVGRQQEADHVPHRAAWYFFHCAAGGSSAFACLTRPRYPPCLNLLATVDTTECLTPFLHLPTPQSLAHLSHKPPSHQRTGLGELGNGPPECKAFHRKMHVAGERETSKHPALTHTFVDPLTQPIHQHSTSTQVGVKVIPARHWSTLFFEL